MNLVWIGENEKGSSLRILSERAHCGCWATASLAITPSARVFALLVNYPSVFILASVGVLCAAVQHLRGVSGALRCGAYEGRIVCGIDEEPTHNCPPTPLNFSTNAGIFWNTACFLILYSGLSGLSL